MKILRCPLCNHVFESQATVSSVVPDQRNRTRCPTPKCLSIPDMWVSPENPLTSEVAWQSWVKMVAKWEKRHGGTLSQS